MGPCTALSQAFAGFVILTFCALTLAVVGNAFTAMIGTVAFKAGRETSNAGDVCILVWKRFGRRIGSGGVNFF
jgi:hypothetical protein